MPGPKPTPTRATTLCTRVTTSLHLAAAQRAETDGYELSLLMRAWLREYAAGQAPTPTVLPDDYRRAPRTPAKPSRRK